MIKRKLVIEKDRKWAYSQWFVLGFYELRNNNVIDMSVATDALWKLSFIFKSERLSKIIKNTLQKAYGFLLFWRLFVDWWKKISFTIDCADTPYMFDYERLKAKDIYFKMQYEKLIKGYIQKQWGRSCKQLPSFIIKRCQFDTRLTITISTHYIRAFQLADTQW